MMDKQNAQDTFGQVGEMVVIETAIESTGAASSSGLQRFFAAELVPSQATVSPPPLNCAEGAKCKRAGDPPEASQIPL